MAKLIPPDKIPPELRSKLNFVKKRILFLSPSVASGHENEPSRTDFEAQTGSTLGVGGFGKVYKVKHKTSRNVYAIKVISKAKIIENNLCDQMRLEIRIMYSLNHEHIIKLCNHFEDDDHFYLVVEYAPKGHLYTKLKLVGKFPERLAAQCMREVISAVQYLHSTTPPIIHRDIKPENVLLDAKERAKLCDFGWSNFFNPESKRMTYCGTPEYLAPEMIEKKGHDQSIDVWNLGVLLFELLTGKPPFQGATQRDLFANILKLKIMFPKGFPALAKDLVQKLLKANPKERISLENALEHPWFKSNQELRPVLTKPVKMDNKLPTLESDLNKEDFEPVSRVSKVHREEERVVNDKEPIKIDIPNKSDKDALIEELNEKIKNSIKEVNDCKIELQAKSHELESIRKETVDIKMRLEGKDIAPDKEVITKLKEELQRLMVLNKNREATNERLTMENTELTSINSQTKVLEGEVETCKGSNKLLESKLAEVKAKLEEMEKKVEEIQGEINKERTLKEKTNVELEMKIDELNYRLKFKLAGNEKEDSEQTIVRASKECDDVMSGIKSSIDQSLKKKADEKELKKQLLAAYKKISALRMEYTSELHEKELRQQKVIEELRALHLKTLNEQTVAIQDSLKELEEQVVQCEEEEQKADIEENAMKSLQAQNNQMQKILDDLNLQEALYTRGSKFLAERVQQTSLEVQELERKLSMSETSASSLSA
jgi:serine/threonine protein kinase